jgi:hypothetical protein
VQIVSKNQKEANLPDGQCHPNNENVTIPKKQK